MLKTKKLATLVASLAVLATPALADEGMWVLPLLAKQNIDVMKGLGCHLTAEQIYSVNNSSMKDAILIFGSGCTGEVVSKEGLVFTNHHCGYDAIQQLSSVEHNYLQDGFWAKSKGEELPVEGLTVRFMESFEDVTSQVVKGIDAIKDFRDVKKTLSDRVKEIEEKASEDGKYDARVVEFYDGNQYILVKYRVFRDIRLVAAPPECIGRFGHETDNWQWPRHTGDFSVFRIYADKDNQPADYSADNKPYKPAYHLPISLKGVQPGDYTMTIGFPGSTERYLSSWGVKQMMETENASRIEPRKIKQDIWKEAMYADPAVYIKYATKFSHSSNYYKNSIGMNKGINDLNVIGRKQNEEKDFAKWAKKQKDKSLATILPELEKAYKAYEPYAMADAYWYECLYNGPELFRFANRLVRIGDGLDSIDDNTRDLLLKAARTFYKDYSPETDKKVTAALLKYYAEKIDTAYQPTFLKEAMKNNDGDLKLWTRFLFSFSMMSDSTNMINAIKRKDNFAIMYDKVMEYALQVYNVYYDKISDPSEEVRFQLAEQSRKYMDARMKMQKDRKFYSDANFTMRLSYGTVGGYTANGKTFSHFTEMDGLMAKGDPNNKEFNIWPKLKELYDNKDYGRYLDKDGKMHVCFTSNNDITGGNSGSPMIDGDGRLIGLAFDGNWEAMSGDIIFEPKLQKCIGVDIRYVLFVIEKVGGAKNLIDELTIVD